MAERIGGHCASSAPATATSPGEVLTFSFLPITQSYIASSYPYPVQQAKFENPDITRDVVFSRSIPYSLLSNIESATTKSRERESANPAKTRRLTLRVGWFFMHITCWRPKLVTPEEEQSDRFDECKESLGLIYSSKERIGAKWWLEERDPESCPGIHPTLESYVTSIHNTAKRIADGGHCSHVALGDTSESFFIRLTDNARNWHYRWRGLPLECDLAVQACTTTSKLDNRDAPTHLTLGRLRAVTLGKGGSWILYKDDQFEALCGGRTLPSGVVAALRYGRTHGTTINQAVLNPHHEKEYVIAFNDGSVFYRFHESFEDDFAVIARQWCNGKVEYKPHPDSRGLLKDSDYYPNTLEPDGPDGYSPLTARNHNRQLSGQVSQLSRVATLPANGVATPSTQDASEEGDAPWNNTDRQNPRNASGPPYFNPPLQSASPTWQGSRGGSVIAGPSTEPPPPRQPTTAILDEGTIKSLIAEVVAAKWQERESELESEATPKKKRGIKIRSPFTFGDKG